MIQRTEKNIMQPIKSEYYVFSFEICIVCPTSINASDYPFSISKLF